MPKNATRGKCAQQLSYGFNILNKLGVALTKKKNPYEDLDFWNFVPKSIGSSVSENFANFYPGLVLHVLHWSHPGLVLHVLCQSLHPPRTQIFSPTTSTS